MPPGTDAQTTGLQASPRATSDPPVATPHGEQVVGSASIGYESIAQWAAWYDGVAIVRVVEVGALRWNTPSGERPPEADLHASNDRRVGTPLVIGRAIAVELVREVRGPWPAPGQRAVWWVPGGRIGADEFILTDGVWPGREAAIGELAVAFTRAEPTQRAIPSAYIGYLFAVDASGRVVTYDPSERVTLDTLDQALP